MAIGSSTLDKRGGTRAKTPDSGGSSTGQVQSLTRGLMLLERIAESVSGVSLTDLALQVGLPNSTTHRLLTTMQQAGFVQQVGDLGLWTIGVRAFTVGSAFLDSRELITIAHPIMRRLVDAAGETANLTVLDREEGLAVLIGQVECREMMRMLAPIGNRMPLHASGAGKAFIATLSDDEVNEVLRKTGLVQYTHSTINTPAKLKEEIARIRRQGFSFDDEEHAIGLRCVAACIYNEYNEPFAAISVSGPKSRIPDERVVHLGSLVVQAAQDITQAFSGISRPGYPKR
ncbi:IclR family transcriptional regulator [Crenobacter luteus]|uniref:Transcriptional repressor IclR n=1 Tax=Crenobacter luteus TaxID=1452487 RepID=A0A163CU87_9NEIS|nr:glyoxylate bypass operon transcriptional repressor IclR [Crenobacter luteus]KZE33186.1 transcriptional repressor IclR [Crenobacter luteus]TCP15692.1 IclR family transcriptional regulator [Crenobacter luteus]